MSDYSAMDECPYLIPSHVEFDMPIESLMSDEDLPELEGLGE